MTVARMDLDRSYETCRRMHRRHDPTYYWATRRLPAEIRPATHALYGYVRTADEIVDGPHRPPSAVERRAALDAWEAALQDGLRAGGSPHPIVGALVDAGTRHRLPLGELERYMASMRRDCEPVRMSTWEELVDYMEGSAGSVGRIMAPLLGVPRDHQAAFGRLGLAFQLTNFIRDLPEDRELDRVYVPAEDLERFDVPEEALAAPEASRAVRALTAYEVQRARGLFASAEAAVAASPRSVRPGIRLACEAYRRVLDRVEASGFDVLGRRPGVRLGDVPRVVLAAVRG
jgi:15-cis-phytoene synthase